MWDGPLADAHVGRFTLWLSRRTWGPGSAGCPPPRFAAMTENHRPWLKGHVFPHGPGAGTRRRCGPRPSACGGQAPPFALASAAPLGTC